MNDFYRRSNTHDPDQDGFEDLFCRDFIHAISRVARRKLSRHHLDPYQRAVFRRGIVRHNTGKEERDPVLETAIVIGADPLVGLVVIKRLEDQPIGRLPLV